MDHTDHPDHPTQDASSSAFPPMGLADIIALSAGTRSALCNDLVAAGDWDRLQAMQEHIPLSATLSHGGRQLDLKLCARLIHGCPPSWTSSLVERVERALVESRGQIQSSSQNQRDFGTLACHFAYASLAAAQAPNGEEEAGHWAPMLDKAIALARSQLPQQGHAGYIRQELLYGFANVAPDEYGAMSSSLNEIGVQTNYPSLTGAALLWAIQGDSRLLDAILERPDAKERLATIAFHSSDFQRDDKSAELKTLHQPRFWASYPGLGSAIFSKAQELQGAAAAQLRLNPRLLSAMAFCSEGDPDEPALRCALDMAGSKLFVQCVDGGKTVADILSKAMELGVADPALAAATEALMSYVFDPAQSGRAIDTSNRWSNLRNALFSPKPGVAERAEAAWRQVHGAESDPYRQCLDASNIERVIEKICFCERPELAIKGLDAIGLEKAQAFPGHRKGLDASITMWIAHKAPLSIFKTALEWFDAQGALPEQADAKAWVYASHETRKKGDLLADCVARGKIEQADVLLALFPQADTKSAREVAKAIASKTTGDAGGVALSAWETLLFRKVLAAQDEKRRAKAGPDPIAEPSPRGRRL